MSTPELLVTNFNRNFTGVSATAAGVLQKQAKRYDLRLVGQKLPGGPVPISKREAMNTCRVPPERRDFAIWHVRRNPEMQAAIWARDVLRLPIRIVFTSAAQRIHSTWPRLLISRMDAVIATTDKAAEFVPNVKSVVPHGVDTERFHPAEDRRAAWTETGYPGKIGIATIGRIRPEKGTDLFVETMLRVLQGHPDVTALVIGKPGRGNEGFQEKLIEKVTTSGMGERILFPGEIAAEKIPQLLRSLSLLVALPRYEGYGMTPLEAMASGTPFVASDAGYFNEFSGQNTAGLVLGQEDPDTASQAISSILENPNRHAAMSIAARQRAQQVYNISREEEGISTVYERLWSSI